MIKKIKDYKKFYKYSGTKKGFALLFAVVVSSIILSVTLGVSDIALREMVFSTSAKDANDAFYAADTAAECALYYDSATETQNAFTGSGTMSCGGNTITILPLGSLWTFRVSNLGSSTKACANVTVDKTIDGITKMTAVGYNNGGSELGICTSPANSVQRVLQLEY